MPTCTCSAHSGVRRMRPRDQPVEPAIALLLDELHVAVRGRRVQADRHQLRPRLRGRRRGHLPALLQPRARIGRVAADRGAQLDLRRVRLVVGQRLGQVDLRQHPLGHVGEAVIARVDQQDLLLDAEAQWVGGSECGRHRQRNLLRRARSAPRFARTRAPPQGRSRSRRSRCRRRPRRTRTPRGPRGASVPMRRPPSVVVMPATTSTTVAAPRRSTGAPAPRAASIISRDRAVAHTPLEIIVGDLVPGARARLAGGPLHDVDLRPRGGRVAARRARCAPWRASRRAARARRSRSSPTRAGGAGMLRP